MNFLHSLKALAKDSIIYGLGNALGKFVLVFTAPILTRIFVPEEYGVMALVQTLINFLIMFVGFNLNSGVYFYFFTYRDNISEKKTILSTSLFFFIIFGTFFSLLAWISAPLLEKVLLMQQDASSSIRYNYTMYIRILSPGILFSLLATNSMSLLRMLRQPYKYMKLSLAQVFLNIFLTLLLVVFFRQGIVGALWASVLTHIIIAILGFFMVRHHYSLSFSLPFLRLFFSYSLPAFPSIIMNWGLSQSNRFFLNYYSSLTQQGYYSIALQIASGFLLFTQAFRLAWDPYSLSIMKKPESNTIYSRFYRLFILGFGFLGGGLALFAKPVLQILTPVSYHTAYSIVFLLVWAFFYQGMNNVLTIGISISKRTQYISYAQLVAFLVNIGLNFLLIPTFYAWGAALAFLGGILAQNVAYYYFSQHVYPIPYAFWRMNLFVLMQFGIVGIGIYVIKEFQLFGALLDALIFTVFLGIVTWKFGISANERQQISKITNQYFIKFSSKLPFRYAKE